MDDFCLGDAHYLPWVVMKVIEKLVSMGDTKPSKEYGKED